MSQNGNSGRAWRGGRLMWAAVSVSLFSTMSGRDSSWGERQLEHVGPRTLSDNNSGPGALALGFTAQMGTRNDKGLLGVKTAGCFEWTDWRSSSLVGSELSSQYPRSGSQPPVSSVPGL